MLEFIKEHLVFFVVISYFLLASIITFFLYFIDKQKAIHNKWRIKERTLLLASLLGGSVGAFFGIFLIRHKTKHWYFPLTCFISLIIHALILYFIY